MNPLLLTSLMTSTHHVIYTSPCILSFFLSLAASGLSCSMREFLLLRASSVVVAARGLSSCGTRALESAGLVALQHVGS